MIEVEVAGVEEARGLEVTHGGQHCFLDVGIFFFEFGEEIAQPAAHGSGALRASTGDDGSAEGGGVGAGDLLGDEDQRADEAELLVAGVGDGGQRAEASGEQGVAEEGFAEVVGGVAEGDDVGSEAADDLIDGAAAVAAAEVAAVIGLFVEEAEGGGVAEAGPGDSFFAQVFADGLDGAQEFTLLDGEGADGEVDGGAFLEQDEGFEQREGIFAAGEGDGHAIAVADHLEAVDRLADLAQKCFFEVQRSIIRSPRSRLP